MSKSWGDGEVSEKSLQNKPFLDPLYVRMWQSSPLHGPVEPLSARKGISGADLGVYCLQPWMTKRKSCDSFADFASRWILRDNFGTILRQARVPTGGLNNEEPVSFLCSSVVNAVAIVGIRLCSGTGSRYHLSQ